MSVIDPAAATLSPESFKRLSGLIRQRYGISLVDAKRVMVELRLRKRLAETRRTSLDDYADYLFSDEGMRDELAKMIDVITTNKTDFFREPEHFRTLTELVLPEIVSARTNRGDAGRPISIWSAACSTGEEPFTIAMAIEEWRRSRRDVSYEILGTDLSATVLGVASRAIYDESRIVPIPQPLRARYLRRGVDEFEGTVRIAPEIRRAVRFARVNLFEARDSSIGPFDVAFLRNVIIYFDHEGKREAVRQVLAKLKPDGYLFVGHSETLFDLDLPIELVRPTVYRKRSAGGQRG